MFENRIRRLLNRLGKTRKPLSAANAFAALPAFAAQAGLASVYELARKQAEEELARKRAARRRFNEWN